MGKGAAKRHMNWYIVMVGMIFLVMLYEFLEHQLVQCRITQLSFPSLPESSPRLRLCMISDLHNNKKLGSRRLLGKIRAFQPDVILLCGDMVSKHTANTTAAQELIRQLAALAPVIYSYGNHESAYRSRYPGAWKTFQEQLPKNCFLLDNEALRLKPWLWIGGLTLPDCFYKKGRLLEQEDLLPQLPDTGEADGVFRILLAHNPDYARQYEAAYHADLILSGHIHGGLVRLPFFGGLISPRLRKPEYEGGFYRLPTSILFVSRGIGSHTLWVRFRNRAELNELILTKQQEHTITLKNGD